MKKPLFFVILIVTSITAFSQIQNRIIDEINYEQGLHSLLNYAIFQDHKGFIWIGSGWQQGGYGLQRYDGYEFINYDQIKSSINNITEDVRRLL
ncbi:MAG: hypothetical protein JXB19_01515 [Bacteroidales bacterium]|nr:hypothetical protein [Bacteroidales bacterium]